MNPFSAFLQPVSRPLQAPDVFSELGRADMQRKDLAERQREADQHNATQQGYLKLQQDQQSHKFAEEDRNEVEGLIKEYQDAVARGEPQGIQDAIQKLKRFGLDVTQQAAQEQAGATNKSKGTSISPFTGMPFMPHNPFTAEQSAVSDGTASSGVRANDPNDDQLLDQSEFENKLIGEASGAPERMESGGQTTEEGKAYLQRILPQGPAEPDPGDEGRNGRVMDLDAPELPAAQETETHQLPGMLPVIVSKGGKELYRSGQAGRWSPLISSVFGPLAEQGDPASMEAGKRAQAMAEKLVTVDGISPSQAIEMAKGMYEKDLDRNAAFMRAQAVAKAKRPGGAGGGFSGKTDDTLNDDLDKVRTMWVNSAGYKKMEENAGQLDDAEAGLLSPDGVSQNNALATLRRIQSGMTLNAQEMRDFSNAAGALENLKKQFSSFLGQGQLPDEYKRQVQGVIARMRQTINQRMERGAQEAYDYWMKSRGRRANSDIIKEKGEALKSSLSGAHGKSEEDLY